MSDTRHLFSGSEKLLSYLVASCVSGGAQPWSARRHGGSPLVPLLLLESFNVHVILLILTLSQVRNTTILSMFRATLVNANSAPRWGARHVSAM